MYGVDVAKSRIDDLDKLLLEKVLLRPACQVLDLGSGSGGMSRRLVRAGATVTAVDIIDYTELFDSYQESTLRFIPSDVRAVLHKFGDHTFDNVLFQRCLHYISYADALTLLQSLKNFVSDSLYISVSGLESDIGKEYTAQNIPITERFHTLTTEEVEKFGIAAPVCLYTRDEFHFLLETAGWRVERLWTSAFGNHKAVAS